jgi:peptidyl-tRNA hydrolase
MSDLRLYVLVRQDIEIPLGKLISQVGHAFLGTFENCKDATLKAEYLGKNPEGVIESGQAKISKKAKNLNALLRAQEECKALGISTALVTDEGRTVFSEPTVTCLGIGPVSRENLPKFVEKMRLIDE